MKHDHEVRLAFARDLRRPHFIASLTRKDPVYSWREKKLVTRFMETENEYLCHKQGEVAATPLWNEMCPHAVVLLVNPYY